jgi:hypothetical protein
MPSALVDSPGRSVSVRVQLSSTHGSRAAADGQRSAPSGRSHAAPWAQAHPPGCRTCPRCRPGHPSPPSRSLCGSASSGSAFLRRPLPRTQWTGSDLSPTSSQPLLPARVRCTPLVAREAAAAAPAADGPPARSHRSRGNFWGPIHDDESEDHDATRVAPPLRWWSYSFRAGKMT